MYVMNAKYLSGPVLCMYTVHDASSNLRHHPLCRKLQKSEMTNQRSTEQCTIDGLVALGLKKKGNVDAIKK